MDVPIVSHPDWMRSTCHTAIGTLDGSYATLIIFLTIQMLLVSFAFLKAYTICCADSIAAFTAKKSLRLHPEESLEEGAKVRVRALARIVEYALWNGSLVLFWTANYRFGYWCKLLWTLLSNIFCCSWHTLSYLVDGLREHGADETGIEPLQ